MHVFVLQPGLFLLLFTTCSTAGDWMRLWLWLGVVNDGFDLKVDASNAPDKRQPSGA
jgi:hypothetical protein